MLRICLSRFKHGQTSMEVKECCGWSSTNRNDKNVERVPELIHQDKHVTVHFLCKSALFLMEALNASHQ